MMRINVLNFLFLLTCCLLLAKKEVDASNKRDFLKYLEKESSSIEPDVILIDGNTNIDILLNPKKSPDKLRTLDSEIDAGRVEESPMPERPKFPSKKFKQKSTNGPLYKAIVLNEKSRTPAGWSSGWGDEENGEDGVSNDDEDDDDHHGWDKGSDDEVDKEKDKHYGWHQDHHKHGHKHGHHHKHGHKHGHKHDHKHKHKHGHQHKHGHKHKHGHHHHHKHEHHHHHHHHHGHKHGHKHGWGGWHHEGDGDK